MNLFLNNDDNVYFEFSSQPKSIYIYFEFSSQKILLCVLGQAPKYKNIISIEFSHLTVEFAIILEKYFLRNIQYC